MRPSIDGSRLDRRRHGVMQIMIIMRLALLDADRAVLKSHGASKAATAEVVRVGRTRDGSRISWD